MANTIAINVSINSDGKTVRYKISIFCTQIAIILLLIITVIWNHYAKHRSKQKNIDEIAK